jgi:hypothetical protein
VSRPFRACGNSSGPQSLGRCPRCTTQVAKCFLEIDWVLFLPFFRPQSAWSKSPDSSMPILRFRKTPGKPLDPRVLLRALANSEAHYIRLWTRKMDARPKIHLTCDLCSTTRALPWAGMLRPLRGRIPLTRYPCDRVEKCPIFAKCPLPSQHSIGCRQVGRELSRERSGEQKSRRTKDQTEPKADAITRRPSFVANSVPDRHGFWGES